MNFREEDETVSDKSKRYNHELALKKLEIKQILAQKPDSEYTIGRYAIKWTAIVLSTLIAGLTVCNSIPRIVSAKKAEELDKKISATDARVSELSTKVDNLKRF